MEYFWLFVTSLASATLFPMGSEALLLYNLDIGMVPLILLLVAGVGNTLGSVVNYWLGLKGAAYLVEKGKLSAEKKAVAEARFARYGGWSLLFSWMPIIGDPLTFIAGILRYSFLRFCILVAIAKFGRYFLIIAGYEAL